MSEPNNFHLDILKGMAVFYDSPFVSDIRKTAERFPGPNLGYALNRNQVTSKKWLIDTLFDVTGGELGRVCVLGGWYGVLGAMLLHDKRFKTESVRSVDLDPSCEEIANCLNRTHVDSGKFEFLNADMFDLDYEKGGYDLIINTSCEHVENIRDWFENVPSKMLLTLQSNNYVGIDGHVNCVENLDQFKQQVPFADVMFKGELVLNNYTRFMLIGRK